VSEPRLGVALTGHWLSLRRVQELARSAEAHGFEVLYVDGDTADVAARDDAHLYDSSALQAAVLAATSRLRVGSLRLPGFMPVVLQARSFAALQALSGGRALACFGVGAGRQQAAIGLPEREARERITELDESLAALRQLFTGARVTVQGRYVQLRGARSATCEPPPPLVVAAARRHALQVVARRADVWDANLPPLAEYLDAARAQLGRRMETWIWVFARPGESTPAAAQAYRRHCPWFHWLPDGRVPEALLCGDPRGWRAHLLELAQRLAVDLVVLDLIGLGAPDALRAIEAFAAPRAEMS
jgi:alkanesulfonate monooxygenase SsuD/methylene tetrahydromethanopterin reductase-like flavin-dependent oxidoreductase (luciferase family)